MPQSDPDCDFCAIANAERDPHLQVIAEADSWVAFFPLEPATPGHTLVIPRAHVPDLWSLDLPLAHDLVDAAVEVGRAIEAALVPDGMNLITSSGEAAEQTINHVHLHLVPRWIEDGFGRIWEGESVVSSREEADAADRIRSAWQSSR